MKIFKTTKTTKEKQQKEGGREAKTTTMKLICDNRRNIHVDRVANENGKNNTKERTKRKKTSVPTAKKTSPSSNTRMSKYTKWPATNSNRTILVVCKKIRLDRIETTKMEGGYQIKRAVWNCYAEIEYICLDKKDLIKATNPIPTNNKPLEIQETQRKTSHTSPTPWRDNLE